MPMAEKVEALLSSRVSQSNRNRERVVGQDVGQKRTTCTHRRWECTRGTRWYKAPRSGAEVKSALQQWTEAGTADPQCEAVDGGGKRQGWRPRRTNIRNEQRNAEFVEECGEGRQFMDARCAARGRAQRVCAPGGTGCAMVLRLTYLDSYCRRSRSSRSTSSDARYGPCGRSLRFLPQETTRGEANLTPQLLRSLQIRRAGTAFNGVGCGELPGR